MADSITTREAAESAGWRIVHEGMNPEDETSTGNAEMWRAEKYQNEPGRAGVFVEAQAVSEEKLYEAIDFREQQFSVSDEGSVFIAKPGEEPDTSDDSTFERVSDSVIAGAARNDTVTVLSDPTDPESDPQQKVFRGGVEIDPEQAETTHEALAEPTIASDSTGTAQQEHADGIASTIEARDGAQTEVTQPAPGTATDASDSEQQSQVPDGEAASSDAISTNVEGDGLAQAGQTAPAEIGPSTDGVAPAPAPNAPDTAPVETAPTQ